MMLLKCLLIKATDNGILPLQAEQQLNVHAARAEQGCCSI